MNKVELVGRLTKDPEVKLTSNQTQFCNFTIAVDRRFKDQNGVARSFDREAMERIVRECEGKDAVITQVRRMRRQTPPPPAYDLTELQRDANKKYAYSAKETLNLMQSLYERHKVLTYPRTDSRYISDDVVPTLPDRIRAVMMPPYKELAQRIMRTRPLQTCCSASCSRASTSR